MTTKEAAKQWKTSEQIVRRLCREGRIPVSFQKDGIWYIPEGTPKPERKESEGPKSQLVPPLVRELLRERTKKVCHGLYDYIQVNFCYSSNRMASNRLMLEQVENIFQSGKVKVGFEPIRTDDIIEAYNHLEAVNHVLETATVPLTQTYIKKLHGLLEYGTQWERKPANHSGEYRTATCTLGKTKTAQPTNIRSQMSLLLSEYEGLDEIGLTQILDFHVKFERIHPFDDGNGRVGRLLLFKECLRYEVTPFILDDKRRTGYLQGIRNWDYDKSILHEACGEAQARFTRQMELQELMKAQRRYLARRGMEVGEQR